MPYICYCGYTIDAQGKEIMNFEDFEDQFDPYDIMEMDDIYDDMIRAHKERQEIYDQSRERMGYSKRPYNWEEDGMGWDESSP